MERSVLAELERAELGARARRLAAAAEADARIAAARKRAERTLARRDRAAARAAAAVRRRHVAEADAAVALLEAEVHRLAVGTRAATDDPAFRDAVELVVAAVLGEREA
jgi:hypothetical protein